jgi:phage regulator Rha-like protein
MAKENENQTQPTSRQRLAERYKGANPELNVDDDETLGGAILGDLEAYDADKAKMERFNNSMQSYDFAPEMLAGMMSGKNSDGSDFDLAEYLIDNHMDFFLDYIEDHDTAKEKLKARQQKRKDEKQNAEAAAKEEEKLKAEIQAKVEAEDAELDAAIAEAGYKPEQVQDLIDWIYDKENGLINRAANFGLKKDDFLRLFQIKDYDVRMADAENKGYKRGKNEKIDMLKRQQKKRDEMPADLGGGGTTPEVEKKDPYLSRLDRMKNF